MPLYIRDDDVARLADELTRLSRARSKTEAVRNALHHEVERLSRRVPLRERIAALQQKAALLGLPNPRFDMKSYTDDMWDHS